VAAAAIRTRGREHVQLIVSTMLARCIIQSG